VAWLLELGEVEYRGRQFLGLRACCGHRQGQRVFRMDRILEMELLEEVSSQPEGLSQA